MCLVGLRPRRGVGRLSGEISILVGVCLIVMATAPASLRRTSDKVLQRPAGHEANRKTAPAAARDVRFTPESGHVQCN